LGEKRREPELPTKEGEGGRKDFLAEEGDPSMGDRIREKIVTVIKFQEKGGFRGKAIVHRPAKDGSILYG